MRQPLAPDRVARFVANLDRLLQQWQLEPERLRWGHNVPGVKVIRGWLSEGKRPSERSVKAVAAFFGFDDHKQLLDRDIGYTEAEKMRQAKANAETAKREREEEERQRIAAEKAAAKAASPTGDPLTDAQYFRLMADKTMRCHVVVQLGMLNMLLKDMEAVGCG